MTKRRKKQKDPVQLPPEVLALRRPAYFVVALIALLGGTATVFGFIGHLIAGSIWAIFHILIIVLQAFIFMMLTLVYVGQAHEGH